MYHDILVPVDGSATAERGLREAVQLAAEHKAKVHLLHVIDDFPLLLGMATPFRFEEDLLREARAAGEQLLERGRAAAARAGVQADTALRSVMRRRVADVVVDEATKSGIDLIVMGTHGRRGFSRLGLGSDAEGVARASTVPVLLVHGDRP
ncbi:universal stress protein [Variovorax robiniae]|uniref:Universal stress protein n=1 Tax=Variovorax robiniae TaxID=1836199 RepID=A0ABU8XCW4_9BURK